MMCYPSTMHHAIPKLWCKNPNMVVQKMMTMMTSIYWPYDFVVVFFKVPCHVFYIDDKKQQIPDIVYIDNKKQQISTPRLLRPDHLGHPHGCWLGRPTRAGSRLCRHQRFWGHVLFFWGKRSPNDPLGDFPTKIT